MAYHQRPHRKRRKSLTSALYSNICGKMTYRSEKAALKLADKRENEGESRNLRAYFCEPCDGYHLTSAPFRG